MTIRCRSPPAMAASIVERAVAGAGAIDRGARRAVARRKSPGSATPLAERAGDRRAVRRRLRGHKDEIAAEITWQMGRPIAYAPGEVRGFDERARYMAGHRRRGARAMLPAEPKAGFRRFIRREPLGVVFAVAPWNYPYLTAVNAVVPALIAGNAVMLKHSPQTPLCAERFADAFAAAGLPDGVFQYLHLTRRLGRAAGRGDPRVDFVAFTGLGGGGPRGRAGRRVGASSASGLELGGKDPAYVRADANLDHAVENLVDGAFFNSGQSCCGIERIYVHASLYDRFVDGVRRRSTSKYRSAIRSIRKTTLGPVVRTPGRREVRAQVARGGAKGAQALDRRDSASRRARRARPTSRRRSWSTSTTTWRS